MNIIVDTADAEQFLDGMGKDQIPFAASVAVNQTAKDVQGAQRLQIASEFILRRADFILRGVKIPRFSNKNDAEIATEILIDDKTDFMRKFERGEPKESIAGKNLAIPIAARPAKDALVPRELRPKNLQLRGSATSGAADQFKGKFGTFIVRGVGILQRVQGHVRLLYLFRRVAQTPPVLHFYEIGQRIVQAKWPENWARAFAAAIRSAK
jgi:hypothetical protein